MKDCLKPEEPSVSAVRLFHIFQRYLRKILKHIGLYDFFAGRFYSVEDFDVYKKNESPDVYARLCQTIGVNPQECIFVDDSYSNLDFAKQCGMTTIRIITAIIQLRICPLSIRHTKELKNALPA